MLRLGRGGSRSHIPVAGNDHGQDAVGHGSGEAADIEIIGEDELALALAGFTFARNGGAAVSQRHCGEDSEALGAKAYFHVLYIAPRHKDLHDDSPAMREDVRLQFAWNCRGSFRF